MADFTGEDPTDRSAFQARWTGILGDEGVTKRTGLSNGQVASHVLSFEESGRTEVSYWLRKEYWGRGIATKALQTFLKHIRKRPLHARVAKDNVASMRVLRKCGFTPMGEDKEFSNARREEVEEFILELRPNGIYPERHGTRSHHEDSSCDTV